MNVEYDVPGECGDQGIAELDLGVENRSLYLQWVLREYRKKDILSQHYDLPHFESLMYKYSMTIIWQ